MSRAQRRAWEASHGPLGKAGAGDTASVLLTATMTVHLLHHGMALCGFAGTPGAWPEGHAWTRVTEAGDATCAGCLAAYNKRWSGHG